VMFQRTTNVYSKPSANLVNFLWGAISNLDGIELGNNTRVAFLKELFHMVRADNF
jgi:hypothetical protein